MARAKANIHGRKPGRGLRPWLLIPKVLAVAIYFGSLVAACAIWLVREQTTLPIATVSFLIRAVSVPALVVSLVLGAVLTMMHWPHIPRMRWWQVKVLSAVVLLPVSHLFLASRFSLLRESISVGKSGEELARQVDGGMLFAIAASTWIIFLGRHKPTLAQNWAKTHGGKGAAGLLIVATLLCCSGCQWWFVRPDAPIENPLRPADFSMSFYVEGEGPYADPIRRTAMFVLESDRRLYAETGMRRPNGYRPRLTRVLTTAEYESIVALIHKRHLTSEPTSPLARIHARGDEPASVLYHVDITGWGEINRYVTTPEESSPSADLLVRLILAAGGRVTTSAGEKE